LRQAVAQLGQLRAGDVDQAVAQLGQVRVSDVDQAQLAQEESKQPPVVCFLFALAQKCYVYRSMIGFVAVLSEQWHCTFCESMELDLYLCDAGKFVGIERILANCYVGVYNYHSGLLHSSCRETSLLMTQKKSRKRRKR
jgi:hypothetical protein